ncbi:pumilio homolog 2-like [Sitodiplosis mosellana]|uniref:pumilio homolog 2-like n=1 Tax=Sitodiplosis mosellana TaxID=263140 RepID=UPI002445127A|nr:pumilio homolog 2-like [Sitodiplosis mosellana]
MKDAFGNYVVQKIFEIGAETQRHELRQIIQTEFMELSMHKYGCRVLQAVFEKSAVHQQIFIITLVFPDDFVELSKNDNGNHVMQQLFRCEPLNVKDYLFDKVKNDIFELSLDPYGSHVIQYILANGSPTHRSEIFKCISRNADKLLKLIQDCYGNYVIQHAVQYCAQTDKDNLMWFIVEGVTALAQDKYASNVVERTLKYAAPDMKKQALRIICNQRPDMDAYANFVVQKLVVDSEDVVMLAYLYRRIRPNLGEIRRHTGGRNIIDKLEQKLRHA